MKQTKIIATIGPVTSSEEKITQLYKSWVNVIRFNFSHANYEEAQMNIGRIKKLNNEWKTNLSLLLDTKWPEIRTWDLKEKNIYKTGEVFRIYTDVNHSIIDNELFCDYPFLTEDIEENGIIVIDSGLLNVRVLSRHNDFVEVQALNDAIIWSRRHVNLPGVKLRLPGMTQKDKNDIEFAIKNDFAFIAASFVRSASNVQEIRDLFAQHNCSGIKIVSKIENQEAIENLDEIIDASDGIMVARWDLGIEVPISKLAIYQKEIVKKCRQRGKFVITATHLLETMIDNPFPTRAESSDVFNAVLQKADSLMLSWETTIGKFPIESVEMMSSIIIEAEKIVKYNFKDYDDENLSQRDKEKKALIRSGLFIAQELWAKAMVILTKSWLLSRITSAFRPSVPVYSFTPHTSSVMNTNLLYGIYPMKHNQWSSENYFISMDWAILQLKEKGNINNDDKIVVINDIQRNGYEFPMLEIIDIKNY